MRIACVSPTKRSVAHTSGRENLANPLLKAFELALQRVGLPHHRLRYRRRESLHKLRQGL